MVANINFTAKDKVNAQGSEASLKDYAGQTIHIIGAAIDTTADVETGEVKNVGYIVADNNGSRTVIPTISATAMDCIDAIIDYMTDENATSVDAVVNSRKSNAGREFLILTLV